MTELDAEPHPVRSPKAPLVDRVTDLLRSEIINLELAPGERLAAEAIASRIAVSPTPVREAFARLAGEGFVVALPQRGVRVSEISPADVRDLYETRLLLEPVAIRRSVARSTDQWIDMIEKSFVDMMDAGAADLAALSPAEYAVHEEAHVAFHRITMSQCDSVWLRRFTDTMLDNSRRVRRLTLAVRTDFEAIVTEHRAIADACVTGDGDLAAQHHSHHLWRTIEAFDEWAATSPAGE
ncbi:GntR family transcriptional regulator [Actinomycetospora atypica]|uniref:GntR family transcriptional regulator n=1 Tax=Actinomycetospora atypica TaxID=1290095 RepID=A0ABV9YSN3_9PSEU